jgi:hypothetical protein
MGGGILTLLAVFGEEFSSRRQSSNHRRCFMARGIGTVGPLMARR